MDIERKIAGLIRKTASTLPRDVLQALEAAARRVPRCCRLAGRRARDTLRGRCSAPGSERTVNPPMAIARLRPFALSPT